MWNYFMGGKDNYPVDRAAGEAWKVVQPEIVTIAKESRRFLIRTVHYLATEAGVRQFLDIGTGLPTMQNTHEVAQAVSPDSRIVYVDNDPVVLAHARALLTSSTAEGVTEYIDADYHRPEAILTQARNTLDFDRPIAVMFMGVLGHVAEFATMRTIVASVVEALPSGSYLTLWDGTDTTEAKRQALAEYAATGAVPYRLRTLAELGECFAGLELVDPGLVPISEWRPELVAVGQAAARLDDYGAVGRKP